MGLSRCVESQVVKGLRNGVSEVAIKRLVQPDMLHLKLFQRVRPHPLAPLWRALFDGCCMIHAPDGGGLMI